MSDSLAGTHRAVICDLDGVVFRGARAVPGAVAALMGCGVPVHYATNNASRTPAEVARHLRGLGLPARASEITTSAQAGAHVLRNRVGAGAEVLTVGGRGVVDAARGLGLTTVTAATPATAGVLQGYGPAVSATDLAEAAYAVEAGAVWVATNDDQTLPTERGIAPGNGTLVAAVRRATGSRPVEIAGKPHAPLYRLCAERLSAELADVLAIGDRLETDIEGAHRLGIPSVLVLTGVHGIRDALLAPPEQRPTWIVPDLTWLTRPRDDAALTRVCRVLASVWASRDRGAQDDDLDAACAEVGRILAVGSTVV